MNDLITAKPKLKIGDEVLFHNQYYSIDYLANAVGTVNQINIVVTKEKTYIEYTLITMVGNCYVKEENIRGLVEYKQLV